MSECLVEIDTSVEPSNTSSLTPKSIDSDTGDVDVDILDLNQTPTHNLAPQQRLARIKLNQLLDQCK